MFWLPFLLLVDFPDHLRICKIYRFHQLLKDSLILSFFFGSLFGFAVSKSLPLFPLQYHPS